MIIIKTPEEIQIMRQGGKKLADIVRQVGLAAKEGVTTQELEDLTLELIEKTGGYPAFKGFKGYPCAACISVNSEVVHGIPSPKTVIKNGDIVDIDIGLQYKGYYTDMSKTYAVGKISRETKKLINVTKKCLDLGIKQIKPGNLISDISKAIENHAEKNGFSVVKDLVGHGVGKAVHEDPQVPNYYTPSANIELKSGMTIAIEPMINVGTSDVEVLDDGWTVVTVDRQLSAHFEHTVAVTGDGHEVLTEF